MDGGLFQEEGGLHRTRTRQSEEVVGAGPYAQRAHLLHVGGVVAVCHGPAFGGLGVDKRHGIVDLALHPAARAQTRDAHALPVDAIAGLLMLVLVA